ncbi:MAG: sigma factor [Rikenellaceae bacterium]
MTKNEFNIYIGEIHGRMLRFAKSILRSEADAQDVVSKVSETLWRERKRLEAKSSASSFAMTSVRNGCYDHARYRSRRLHQEPSNELVSDENADRGDTYLGFPLK